MDPRRILVVQLRRIGDVLLSTPAVRALKSRFPQASIHFLVEPPSLEVVRDRPEIDEVLVYAPSNLAETLAWLSRIRSRNYDLVVDFMGNPRTALLAWCSDAPHRAGPAHVFHRWAYNIRLPQSAETVYAAREKIRMLAPLGVPDEPSPLPAWPRRPDVRAEDLVGLMPASRKETRRWPAEHYAALGRKLRDELGVKLLVFWGPGEFELAKQVADAIGKDASVCEKTASLQALAEQILRCKLVVTNCAGPKHIAVALDVPTLTIHSSSDPKAWTPMTERHRSIRRDELHCIGCRLNECPYHMECMRDLSPERVFAAAQSMLQGAAA